MNMIASRSGAPGIRLAAGISDFASRGASKMVRRSARHADHDQSFEVFLLGIELWLVTDGETPPLLLCS
jgi:hypothetical protein